MSRYKIIGHIERECEICGKFETLLVINDKVDNKIIARCDSCKPKVLKNDNTGHELNSLL